MTVTATARDAGRNVVHTVTVDGKVIGTRRSAHRYRFAICESVPWGRFPDGSREYRVIVRRWSRNAKATGSTFAVPVQEA